MIAAYVALGQPLEAKATADRINDESVYVRQEECELMARLADPDLAPVAPQIRTHALDAVTGRLSRKANDSLLFLAWLARSEDDLKLAKKLLLQVGVGRSPASNVLSRHLADLLGTQADFDINMRTSHVDL